MTHLDLDHLLRVAERTEHWGYKDDVPALVAEVRSLREMIALLREQVEIDRREWLRVERARQREATR